MGGGRGRGEGEGRDGEVGEGGKKLASNPRLGLGEKKGERKTEYEPKKHKLVLF